MICTIYSLHELASTATDWIVSENSRLIFFEINFLNFDQEAFIISFSPILFFHCMF